VKEHAKEHAVEYTVGGHSNGLLWEVSLRASCGRASLGVPFQGLMSCGKVSSFL